MKDEASPVPPSAANIEIANLFIDRKVVYQATDWYEILRNDADAFANCRVLSFTRVKNLDSWVKHEYVQFIVEEATTGQRTRVYAERDTKANDGDHVTVGPLKLTERHDLPLPLVTMYFGLLHGVRDDSRLPNILDVAEILARTSEQGGDYNILFNAHCYWYAKATYGALHARFGDGAMVEEWKWNKLAGTGGDFWGNLGALLRPSIPNESLNAAAKDFIKQLFSKERLEGPTPLSGTIDISKSPKDLLQKDEKKDDTWQAFEKDDVLDEYIDVLRKLSIDLDKDTVRRRIHETKENGIHLDLSDGECEDPKALQAWVDRVVAACERGKS